MSGDSFILDITNKYLRHLGSIERLMATYDSSKVENIEKGNDVGKIIDQIANLKYNLLVAEKLDDKEKLGELNIVLQEQIETNAVNKMFFSKIQVNEDEEGYEIELNSPFLRKSYEDYLSNTLDSKYDDSQFRNSLIVSLVIGLEVLISEIFKDFAKNLDITNQMLKDKQLSYSLLKEIGSVEEAKSFLIDQYIEKLLRDSFISWIDEIKSTIGINLNKNVWIKDDIKLLNETIQRRHLIIHNDGVVNDLYLNKIDSSLRNNLVKNEELFSNVEYITDRLSTFKKFGLILIYLYGKKKYRRDPEELFMKIHGVLVNNLRDGFHAPRVIFKDWTTNEGLKLHTVGMCYINYFLTFKLQGDHTIDNEIEDFDAPTYGDDFIFAKKVLLEPSNCEELVISFLERQHDDDFIYIISWPLLKVIEKTDIYKDYVQNRFERIALDGLEDELIENS